MSRRITKFNNKEVLGVIFVLVLFIAAGYFSELYQAQLSSLVGLGGFLGMLFYVFITIIAVVIAPVSTLPALPIAVALWGSVIGALLSILGWTIGGLIAYILARSVGRPFIGHFADIKKVQHFGEVLAGKNPFWTVVLLRMVVPVDILSYALGFFVNMSRTSYTLATLIGVTPFAFVFAFAATLPVMYQIGALTLASAVAVLGYIRIRNAVSSSKNK